MSKDPAFLFYAQDWITGTVTMTMEERGQYITILSVMHQKGHLTEETIRFLVGNVSDNLKDKFLIDDDGKWYNERLDLEIEKRANFVNSRRENGSKGGRPPKSSKPLGKPNDKPSGLPTQNLTENEDENEVLDLIKKGIPSQKEFLAYGLERASMQRLNVSVQRILDKYDAWIENGWKNGNDKPLRNWKSSLINTLPHIAEKKSDGKPETEEERSIRETMEEIKNQAQRETLYGKETEQQKLD